MRARKCAARPRAFTHALGGEKGGGMKDSFFVMGWCHRKWILSTLSLLITPLSALVWKLETIRSSLQTQLNVEGGGR
jgi:hypothetical protein